ncbi:hypothetical protein MJO29_015022, partial [Puccinia striiformis f. sp. tritici]
QSVSDRVSIVADSNEVKPVPDQDQQRSETTTMEAHPDPVTPTSQRQPADKQQTAHSGGIQRGRPMSKTRNASAQFIETPKDLQIRANVVLAQLKNCFTLAGTGFGKTRIAEMFYNLFPRKKNP